MTVSFNNNVSISSTLGATSKTLKTVSFSSSTLESDSDDTSHVKITIPNFTLLTGENNVVIFSDETPVNEICEQNSTDE